MTKSKLSEKLDASRPTVSKYVDELQEDGKIKEMNIGDFKFWALAEKQKSTGSLLKVSYRLVLKTLLLTFEQYYGNDIEWNKFGRKMADNIEFENIIQTHQFYDYLSQINVQEPVKMESIKAIGKLFHQIFRTIVLLFDDCTIENEPIIIENPIIITLRIKESNFQDENSILQIIAGIIEKKMEKDFFNLQCKISYQINKKASILDIIIKLEYFAEFIETIASKINLKN